MQMEEMMFQLFPHNIKPNQTFLTSQREWYTVTKKAVTDVKFKGLKLQKLHDYLVSVHLKASEKLKINSIETWENLRVA